MARGRIFQIKFTKPFLEQEYITNQKSIGQIAKENQSNPSCVRRHLQYFAIPARTMSEAQSLAESSGRRKNPTKGRKRRPDEIKNVAVGVSNAYHSKTNQEKDAIKERLRQQYNNMDEDSKKKFHTNGNKAVRESSNVGSYLENYIYNQLMTLGEEVKFHTKYMISNENMHFDLFLPKRNLVIEIDGPTHMRPVYSDEEFSRKRERDNRKNGLIIESGLRIIRLGVERADSLPSMDRYYQILLSKIKEINGDTKIIYAGDYNQ